MLDYFDTQLGIQLDKKTVITHVHSRCFPLIPAAGQVIVWWETVHKCFWKICEISQEKNMQRNNRSMRICDKLMDPSLLMQLHFLKNCEPLFILFLTLLQ